MQLTLTADSLARALDVAAAPYRNCPTRPGKHDPASTLVLEATTEGLMCTGSSEQLTAFTLADYLHTAPAALPHLTPAQMPAAAAHRVRQALADAADGWPTVNTTAALIYFDAHGFDAPVEIPNVWGTLPARDLDADRPTPGPPTPGAQLTALTPGALAALSTALARHAHPYSRQGRARGWLYSSQGGAWMPRTLYQWISGAVPYFCSSSPSFSRHWPRLLVSFRACSGVGASSPRSRRTRSAGMASSLLASR